eukprot:713068-Rhodomonas_salina.1
MHQQPSRSALRTWPTSGLRRRFTGSPQQLSGGPCAAPGRARARSLQCMAQQLHGHTHQHHAAHWHRQPEHSVARSGGCGERGTESKCGGGRAGAEPAGEALRGDAQHCRHGPRPPRGPLLPQRSPHCNAHWSSPCAGLPSETTCPRQHSHPLLSSCLSRTHPCSALSCLSLPPSPCLLLLSSLQCPALHCTPRRALG